MPAAPGRLLGRKRVLPSCPNPLFLRWLTELRDQARDRGLKTQHVYSKAIGSLQKYPLPLQNAREAKILQNFGDGICKLLDQKLQNYYREHGPDAPIHSLPEGAPPAGPPDNNSLAPPKKNNVPKEGEKEKGRGGGGGRGGEKRKKREYVPQKRSGGYAVLLTLYRHAQIPGDKGYMFKMELQNEAQLLCDKSFTAPDLGSKYTAWSSVTTLIHKNLVVKTHNPARYSLSEEGTSLAERLASEEQGSGGQGGRDEEGDRSEEKDGPGVVDLTASDEEEEEEEEEGVIPPGPGRPACVSRAGGEAAGPSASGKAQASEPSGGRPSGGRLLPGNYDIILCVDFIETTGGSNHRKQDLVKELQRNGVTFDVRKLNVGDFLWVARQRVAPIPGQLRAPVAMELVLDYIIERKRMDDLCGSIIDGRFREQKFRLKRCGLSRPVYLVEECGTAASHLSLPEATLQQAIINTQVVDGFFVKRVQDVRESAAYLTVMTRYLTKLYQNCTLVCRSRELEGDAGMQPSLHSSSSSSSFSSFSSFSSAPSLSLLSFAEFNYGAVKNKSQTVREVFARQLMQISGLSGDKAAAILDQYTTPRSLLCAYECCPSDAAREKLLSNIRYGKLNRNIGPALSRTVYQLYCTQGPLS